MGESIKLSGENQAETKSEDVGESYPDYNPDLAKRLQAEDAPKEPGLNVSHVEAMKIGGEVSMYFSHEDQEAAKTQLEAGLADGSLTIRRNLSHTERLEANRGSFAEIQKRRAFLVQLYPQLLEDRTSEGIPASVRSEFATGDSICSNMLHSERFSGPVVQLPNGMSLHGPESAIMIASRYEQAKKLNDQIIDQKALAEFSLQDLSESEQLIQGKIDQIKSASSSEELDEIAHHGPTSTKLEGFITNIDTAFRDKERPDMNYMIKSRRIELEQQKAMSEIDALEQRIAKIDAEQKRLEEEYDGAGFFKKAAFLIGGHKKALKKLESSKAKMQDGIRSRKAEHLIGDEATKHLNRHEQ